MISHDAPTRRRMSEIRAVAQSHRDGLIDCNIGTPCDPVPDFVREAVSAAVAASGPYPLSAGSSDYRSAAAHWIARRFGVEIDPNAVAACVGTKEFVASLPHYLRILARGTDRDHRDTILFPAIAYPTYAVGAAMAGLRSVPVSLDAQWNLDLSTIDPVDADRALALWVNVPGNPTSATASRQHFDDVVQWGQKHGVLVVSDECYVEYAPEPHTILEAGSEGVLALHSLSKRSNFAGMRNGFYAGDPSLVQQLIDLRREGGLIVPTPMQAGGIAVLADDVHVDEQRLRYERRRTFVIERLAAHGIEHVGGAMPFYLWLVQKSGAGTNAGESTGESTSDGFDLAMRFARCGWLTAPGATFGSAGTPYTRIALVQPDHLLLEALDRFDALNLSHS